MARAAAPAIRRHRSVPNRGAGSLRARLPHPGPPAALRSRGGRRAWRRQAVGWTVVALVIVLVHRSMSQAASARTAWTGDSAVVVLRSAVPAGRRIQVRDVVLVRAPRTLTPSDALRSLPRGAVAAIDLRTGTAIGRSMLRSSPRSAASRSLEPGQVAVVVRTGDLPTPASRGDVVDVASPGWDGPVAARARVIRMDGDTVTLGVREQDATSTAAAALSGPVALVLRG